MTALELAALLEAGLAWHGGKYAPEITFHELHPRFHKPDGVPDNNHGWLVIRFREHVFYVTIVRENCT